MCVWEIHVWFVCVFVSCWFVTGTFLSISQRNRNTPELQREPPQTFIGRIPRKPALRDNHRNMPSKQLMQHSLATASQQASTSSAPASSSSSSSAVTYNTNFNINISSGQHPSLSASTTATMMMLGGDTTATANVAIVNTATTTNSSTSSSASANASANAASTTSSNAATLSAVEELVYEIKENLRLKARPAATATVRSSRPSPYHIPCRSWSESATSCDKQQLLYSRRQLHQRQQQSAAKYSHLQHHHHHHHQHHQHYHHGQQSQPSDEPLDDPYELLQTLLKSNNLVKEAVRRLQLNCAGESTLTAVAASTGGSTGGSASSNCDSPRRPFTYYDSDSEDAQSRMRLCQLEL